MTGFTTVTAEHPTDTSGALIRDATIWFQPCDDQGNPTSFHIPPKGQAGAQPVSTQVRDGQFTIQLADTTNTSPANICFALMVIDNATGSKLLKPHQGYLIQPSGAAWDFDAFIPGTPPQATAPLSKNFKA